MIKYQKPKDLMWTYMSIINAFDFIVFRVHVTSCSDSHELKSYMKLYIKLVSCERTQYDLPSIESRILNCCLKIG